MNRAKDKGKEKVNKPSSAMQSYKTVMEKSPKQLKAEIMEKTPSELKLREDAYSVAKECDHHSEFLYPYIPISTEWITPVEKKYSHLSPLEISTFYLKDYADPYHHPKNFQYYFHILEITKSVEFDSVKRGGYEYAYSKAFIKRVITPEQWNGDLYNFRETSKDKTINPKPWFNYFDYMKAWSGAFCYENRQMKHSWFLQFRDFDTTNVPQWFILWFSNWGLNPIILPDKIRSIFDEFSEINKSMKFKELMFAALYQVPWILRWDVIIRNVPIKKFEVIQGHIPYMGRRILIKWWEKFNFFEESIYSKRGLINLEPVHPPPPPESSSNKDIKELLKELLKGTPKEELKDILKDVLSDNESEHIETASGHSDDTMQDAQDPFDV